MKAVKSDGQKHKGKKGTTLGLQKLDKRAAIASQLISTNSASAMVGSIKALKKLKKMKTKAKKAIKKRQRPRSWDSPSVAGRIIHRRASVFGSISSANEFRTHYFSHSSLSRKYEFVNEFHLTEEQDMAMKAKLITSGDSVASSANYRDDVSLTSSIVSFPRHKKNSDHEFPKSAHERKMIIANISDDQLFYQRKNNLYSVLRDRYDPDHSESPMDPLYCFSALCLRESLLFNPDVRATLDEIWHITDVDNNNSIDYSEYEKMHEAMSVAVYGSNYLKKDIKIRRKLCLQDWNLDRDGEDHLNYSRFTMCWFQLADQFTDKIVAEDYIKYLRDMFFKMVEVDAGSGRPKWKNDRVIAGLEKSEHKAYDMELNVEAVNRNNQRRKSLRAERRSRGSLSGAEKKAMQDAADATLREEEERRRKEEEKIQGKSLEEEEEIMERERRTTMAERETMQEADLESAAVEALLSSQEENDEAAGLFFDDIMDQYVDRSSFTRHHRTSGGINVRRRESTLRHGHLGSDATEDEIARHKRMTAGLKENTVEKEETVSMGELSSMGSGSLVEKQEETNSQVVGRMEDEAKKEVKRKEVVQTRRETLEMGAEEELVREVVAEEKRIEEEIKLAEATVKAQEAFKETIERETMEFEEWKQREVEFRVEQKKVLEKAKASLRDAEFRAFEEHLKKLETKRRKRRPMKGRIMVKGKPLEMPEEGVRQPHSSIGGIEELLARIQVREKEKIDWERARERLTMRRTELGSKIEHRKMMTTQDITKLKQEAAKRQQVLLEDKVMMHGTWEKGTSHLYWSNSDSSAIVSGLTKSLMAGNSATWLGYHLGSTIGPEHATSPFFVGRPVTPIVWNSSKRTEPFVVETPRQWDFKGHGHDPVNESDEVEVVPKSGKRQEKERPRTSSGASSKKPNQEIPLGTRPMTAAAMRNPAPFQEDLIPLETRYAFETKKRIMIKRTLKSAERKKMGYTSKNWRPSTVTQGGREASRAKAPHAIMDPDRNLFQPEQLSSNWSPQMRRMMRKIFDPAMVNVKGNSLLDRSQKTAKSTAGLTSPIKKVRPKTSQGRLRSPGPSQSIATELAGLGFEQSMSTSMDSLMLYQRESPVSGSGILSEKRSLDIFTPQESIGDSGSLAQPSLAESFASSHVRLVRDGLEKVEGVLIGAQAMAKAKV